MSNDKQRLDDLKEKVSEKTIEQAKLQERVKTLQEDIEKYESQLKELNVTENDLSQEIETLQEQFNAGLEKAEGQLE